jgi:hypothetical protein
MRKPDSIHEAIMRPFWLGLIVAVIVASLLDGWLHGWKREEENIDARRL